MFTRSRCNTTFDLSPVWVQVALQSKCGFALLTGQDTCCGFDKKNAIFTRSENHCRERGAKIHMTPGHARGQEQAGTAGFSGVSQ